MSADLGGRRIIKKKALIWTGEGGPNGRVTFLRSEAGPRSRSGSCHLRGCLPTEAILAGGRAIRAETGWTTGDRDQVALGCRREKLPRVPPSPVPPAPVPSPRRQHATIVRD